MTAAEARYTRFSATGWVAIGTMLEVGDRITKNAAARKPTLGQRNKATVVTASRPANAAACGHPLRKSVTKNTP